MVHSMRKVISLLDFPPQRKNPIKMVKNTSYMSSELHMEQTSSQRTGSLFSQGDLFSPCLFLFLHDLLEVEILQKKQNCGAKKSGQNRKWWTRRRPLKRKPVCATKFFQTEISSILKASSKEPLMRPAWSVFWLVMLASASRATISSAQLHRFPI